MNTSKQINEIASALAKAQAEIQNPAKDNKNSHFGNKYADLAGGLATIRPTLAKHGLSVVQLTHADGDMVTLHTRIMHSSGQWLEATYPVCRLGKHQEMGSALTYARRYALFAAVGVAGDDDDDDGNTAATARGRPAAAYAAPRTAHSIKKDDPDAWPTFEKDVRAATTLDDLNAAWKKHAAAMNAWPASWQEKADEEFNNQLDVIGSSAQAAE